LAQCTSVQTVQELLRGLRGLDPLKRLFWTELNYGRVNKPLSRREWPGSASQALSEDPNLLAAGGQDDAFTVIYSRLDSGKLLLGQERSVVSRLLQDHPYALFVFSNRVRTAGTSPTSDTIRRRVNAACSGALPWIRVTTDCGRRLKLSRRSTSR
jgi:hypothetical protein